MGTMTRSCVSDPSGGGKVKLCSWHSSGGGRTQEDVAAAGVMERSTARFAAFLRPCFPSPATTRQGTCRRGQGRLAVSPDVQVPPVDAAADVDMAWDVVVAVRRHRRGCGVTP